MDKHQWLGLVGFLTGSYATFHGHRLNKDCWLCQYRGLGWIIALAGITYAKALENEAKEKANLRRRSSNYHYQSQPLSSFTNSSTTYNQNDVDWENCSEAGSDTYETDSNDSNETIKGEDNKTNQE